MTLRKLAFITLLISPTLALAAEPQSPFASMQTSGMQDMMKNMQGIQMCMSKIDQSKLQAVAAKAQTTQTNIKNLCAQGNSAEAEKIAVAFAREIQGTPEMSALQNCLKDLPEMMKGHIQGTDMAQLQKEFEQKNICALAN